MVDEDLESLAQRLFNEADRADMCAACLARVDDALLSLPEHASEEVALRATRSRLLVEEQKT
jgi:transcriptional regulator